MDWLEIIRLGLRYLHLIGFTLLFGGFVTQYLTGTYRPNVFMHTGLATVLGTGLVLVMPFPRDEDLDYLKFAVKLGIVLAIGGMFQVTRTRERLRLPIHKGHFLPIGGLALLAAAVAVFWH